MKTMDLIQEVYFKATPERLFEILMSSREHGELTDSEVEIVNELGGSFRVYGDYITGTNILLEPGKMIIQEWKAAEEEWPDYHMSTVQFKLDALDGGTHLTFVHKGIPEACFEGISNGWEQYYWGPLKRYLDLKG